MSQALFVQTVIVSILLETFFVVPFNLLGGRVQVPPDGSSLGYKDFKTTPRLSQTNSLSLSLLNK